MSGENNVQDMPVRKTELEIAKGLKDAILPKLHEVCAIMQAARHAGMVVHFQINQNSFGRFEVQHFEIVKPLQLP